MIRRLKTTPKILYVTIAFILAIFFFMFYSFNVDEDAVVEGYKSNMKAVQKEAAIENVAKQVSNIKSSQSSTGAPAEGLDGLIQTAKDCLKFLYDNDYNYSTTAADIPVDKKVYKATNCGYYVVWVLNTYYGKDVYSYTSAAQVATQVYKQGWEVNTDYDGIQDGDVIFMTQGQTPNSSMVDSMKAGKLGSGYHVEICVDAKNKLYCNAGWRGAWINHKGEPYKSDVSKRFICSFHFKGKE